MREIKNDIEIYNDLDVQLINMLKILNKISKKTLKESVNGNHLSAIEVIDLDEEINICKHEINLEAVLFLKKINSEDKVLRKIYTLNLITDKIDRISNNYKKINKQFIISTEYTSGTKLDLIRMLKYNNALIDLILKTVTEGILCNRQEIIKLEEKIQKIFISEINKGEQRSYNYNHYLVFKHIENIGDNIRGIYEQLYFIEKGKYIEV